MFATDDERKVRLSLGFRAGYRHPSLVLSDGGHFAMPTTPSKRVTTSIKGTLVTYYSFLPSNIQWQNTTRQGKSILVNLFSADTAPPTLVSSNVVLAVTLRRLGRCGLGKNWQW